jgi:hypothetical protein
VTDEEAAQRLESLVVFDDAPDALEPYRLAVATLRAKAQLVEALAKWDSCQSSACLNGGVCLGCANGMRAALQAAKEAP